MIPDSSVTCLNIIFSKKISEGYAIHFRIFMNCISCTCENIKKDCIKK